MAWPGSVGPLAIDEIMRESWHYTQAKPGRVPPADSHTRPHLARLWQYAAKVAKRRPNAHTFTYAGSRFGVVYMGNKLCVMELRCRSLLVKAPSSKLALAQLLEEYQ